MSITLVSKYFSSTWLRHVIKTNCIKSHTIDPEIYFDFFEKSIRVVFHHVWYMIFEKKYFLCYILLTDLILFFGLLLTFDILHELRIINICFRVEKFTKFRISLSFLVKPFSWSTKIVSTKTAFDLRVGC